MQNSLSFDRSHFILLQRIKIFIKQEKDKERKGKERKGKERKGKEKERTFHPNTTQKC